MINEIKIFLWNLYNVNKTSYVNTWNIRNYKCLLDQCDQKKLPNDYKSCPKMISLEKWSILTPLQKLLKNVADLGKLIVAKGFKNLPKVQ